MHSTLETQSPNHWTTREVSDLFNISQCSLLPGISQDSRSRYMLVPVTSSRKTTFPQQTRHVVTISGSWLASSSVVTYGNFRDLFGEPSQAFYEVQVIHLSEWVDAIHGLQRVNTAPEFFCLSLI